MTIRQKSSRTKAQKSRDGSRRSAGMKAWTTAICLIGVWMLAAGAPGNDWANWRGPFFNGSTEATNLPHTWSTTDGVAWSTPMPGRGAGTPIIVGNRVFVTSTETDTPNLYALCLDRQTGQILWKKKLSSENRSFGRNDQSSLSPAADHQHAYFLFGTGDLAALDMEGNEVWRRDLEKDYGRITIQFGYSSSPLLYEGKLYVLMLRNPIAPGGVVREDTEKQATPLEPYMLALDPATGNTVWKQKRPTDALRESPEAYTTAVPRGKEIVVAGADYVTGHDCLTGKELWRLAYNPGQQRNWRLVPSPTIIEDVIVAAIPRGSSLFAFRPKDPVMSFDSVLWTFANGAPDVPCPLYYQGRLYVVSEKGKISCLDPKTGSVFWQEELPPGGLYYASPTGADGKIYCMHMNGLVVVLKAGGDSGEILAQIDMGDKTTGSSISVAGGRLFIRTNSNLYCIGK